MLFIFNLNFAFANMKTSGQVSEHRLAISTIGRQRPTEQMMVNINYRWDEFLSRFVSGQKKCGQTNRDLSFCLLRHFECLLAATD
jgi:hypothetical protein